MPPDSRVLSRQNACEPIPSGYAIPLPDDETMLIEIVRVGQLARGRFDYTADVWAIRCMSRCFNREGVWEWEPLSSSRDDAFKSRTRWPLNQALLLAEEAAEAGNYPGGPAHRWKVYPEEER